MRPLVALILCLLLSCLVSAQEEPSTPYEIALQRIEEARVSGATELSLSRQELTELPPEIGSLSQLRRLDLTVNSLSELPPELGNLSNLEGLNLSGNQLGELFPQIGNLENLTDLSIQNNQLQVLPSEIGELHNLQYLDVSYNQLNYLPSEITGLRSLNLLDLSNNQLRELPMELGSLQLLCFIVVSDNLITTLPETLANLPMFNTKNAVCDGGFFPDLVVDNNPLTSPPPEVIEQGTPAILDYLRNPLLWHIRRYSFNWAAATGGILALFFALRWRINRTKGKKKKGE